MRAAGWLWGVLHLGGVSSPESTPHLQLPAASGIAVVLSVAINSTSYPLRAALTDSPQRLARQFAAAHGLQPAAEASIAAGLAQLMAQHRAQPPPDCEAILGGDPAGAAACFRAQLRLQPNSAGAYNNLGLALEGLGRWEAAVTG